MTVKFQTEICNSKGEILDQKNKSGKMGFKFTLSVMFVR